jgi:hypothetical protein
MVTAARPSRRIARAVMPSRREAAYTSLAKQWGELCVLNN